VPKYISLFNSVIRHVTTDDKNSICGLVRHAHQSLSYEKDQSMTDKKPLCAACSIIHARNILQEAKDAENNAK